MIHYTDTHAHLYLPQFDDDRADVITRAQQAGVNKVLLPNIDNKTINLMFDMVRAHPDVCHAMVGLHPCSVTASFNEILAEIEQHIGAPGLVAIGEIGTDLHWDNTQIEAQKAVFKIQLEWAKESALPVVIHSRDSLDLNIEIVEEAQDGRLRGVFHCFNGSLEQADRITEIGFHMGLGGVTTFKNAGLTEMVQHIPVDRILFETDAPYLTPTPHRGKRNESAYLPLVAQHVAAVRHTGLEALARRVNTNAADLFALQ